jgi:polyhydroxybutyrate depolymerase
MTKNKKLITYKVLTAAGVVLALLAGLVYRQNPLAALTRGAGYVLLLWLLMGIGILLALVAAFFWVKVARGWKWARNYLLISGGVVIIVLGVVFIPVIYEHRQYHHIDVAGVQRQYLIYVPSSYKPGQKMPLLVGLHGGMGNARQFEKDNGFDLVAEKEGFIAVYPDGLGKFKYTMHVWNSGYIQAATNAGTDDVAFIKDLVEYIKAIYSIDASRVYITGHSNGGMMTDRMAAEYPEIFAAAAPVSSAIGGQATRASPLYMIPQPDQPVSIVRVHGLLDKNVLYQGGFSQAGVSRRARYDLSEKESTAFWIKNDGCQNTAQLEQSANGQITLNRFSGGRNNTEVVLVTINNADHAWENMNQSIKSEQYEGATLAEMIWNLMKGYSK